MKKDEMCVTLAGSCASAFECQCSLLFSQCEGVVSAMRVCRSVCITVCIREPAGADTQEVRQFGGTSLHHCHCFVQQLQHNLLLQASNH